MKICGWCLALAMTVCFSCGAAETGDDERPEGSFGKLEYQWTIEAEYPIVGVEAIDSQIRKWVEDNALLHMDENKDLVTTEFEKGGVSLWMNYELTRPHDGFLTVVMDSSVYYRSAAHPNGVYEPLYFLVPSGERLEVKDLFENPDAVPAILSRVTPALVVESTNKQMAEANRSALIEESDFFMDGFDPKWENFECLVPEKGGVRVYFQRYQVLAYVYGNPSCFVPLGLLEEAGPKKAIWPE